MEVKFKFNLGQKVKLENGVVGIVTSMAVYQHLSVNKVGVRYTDNNGAIFNTVAEEPTLEAVE